MPQRGKSMIFEDIAQDFNAREITFQGHRTKNLHHSQDARNAFNATIQRAKNGLVDDRGSILRALKSTDIYMGLNDLHLEQNRAANPEELAQWSKEHQKAADALKSLGGNEFMHHFDYWNNHKQELQMLQASAAMNNPMGESLMTNLSHNPFQDALDLQESMQLDEASPVTSWKKEVKDIHGKDVKFEEEKRTDRYSAPMVHAYDKHGNKVGHIEKKSGYKFIFKTPFDKKMVEHVLDEKKCAIAAAIANRIAEEVCESFTVKDHAGNVVHVAYSEGDAKRKAAAFAQKTGKPHSVAYAREQHPTK